MKKISIFATTAMALLLNGCVYVSIPFPEAEPLAEKVIGGHGPDKVLVVDLSGVISDDEVESFAGINTEQNITARVKEELDLAYADKAVKAVVLRINTPGGSVTTCDIITHEIAEFKKDKKIPIVAELMDTAASGGYYIAVTADKIIAHPTTVTGSIGVIAYNVNAAGLLEKIGVVDATIKSGDKKDIGSPLRPMTKDDKAILQSIINELYDKFIDTIMEGRKSAGLTREALLKLADGRIYTANQAKEAKLIDSIGYLDNAIDEAKEAAGLKGKDATIITYAQRSNYKSNIYSKAYAKAVESKPAGNQVNIVNIDARSLTRRVGASFMFLWTP